MIDKQLLLQIVIEQAQEPLLCNIVKRWQQQELMSLVGNKQIIIISGIRRAGKSTLMQLVRQNIKEHNYCLSFDDDRLISFTVEDFALLLDVFIELYGVQNTFYFDEIQNIFGWERFVRRLHNEGKKIFITGSNAHLLSNELGTHLTGRYIGVRLFPYSFREFVTFVDPQLLTIEHLTPIFTSL